MQIAWQERNTLWTIYQKVLQLWNYKKLKVFSLLLPYNKQKQIKTHKEKKLTKATEMPAQEFFHNRKKSKQLSLF